jgi:adenylosuccinate lyase
MARKTLLAGAALALVLTGTTGVAVADTGPTAKPSANPTTAAKNVAKFCARVDRVSKRIDRLTGRISAGPDQRGSVRWLQARADKARTKNPQRAALIDQRIGLRQNRLAVLKLRRQGLTKAQTWCAAQK